MGPTIALTISAFSGGILLLMAVALLVALPTLPAVRFWAASWVLFAAGCFLVFLSPFVKFDPFGTWELTLRTALVLGGLLAQALGLLAWFDVPTDHGRGPLLRSVLWGGTILALIPVVMGVSVSDWVAWTFVSAWSVVPVLSMVVLLAFQGLPSSRLLTAVLAGSVPYVLSWVILPSLPGTVWTLGFPPFLILGAGLVFWGLIHRDAGSRLGPVAAVEPSQDTALFLQSGGRIQAANPSVRTLLEREEAELAGRPLTALAADEEARHLLTPLEALTFPEWEGTLTLLHRTGRAVPVHLVYRRVHNPAREAVGAVLLLSDLRVPRHLDFSTREDLLTSLASRRWVLELLEAEFQRVKRYGGPLCVLWIDIVPRAEDEVLQRLAGLIKGGLRKTDFCGRVGGREFLAVLPDTSEDKAKGVAGRFERMFALASLGDQPGTQLRVGTASVDGSMTSINELLARARAVL